MISRKIVLIMTDSQRWDMVGCYGNRDMKTPHLDALAAGGIRFDRAYTCQPVCGPARAALFTGTYPHGNGSWGNCTPLGQGSRTIGQRLSEAGMHTSHSVAALTVGPEALRDLDRHREDRGREDHGRR